MPAASEGALSLRAGTPPLTVGEAQQVDADAASLVALPRGRTLEIGAASAGPDKTWGTKDDIQTWQ